MLKYLFSAVLFLCFDAHADAWKAIYTCNDNKGAFVIDRHTDNPSALQFVIHGASVVGYIAASMRGHQVSLPGNVHVYENGNTLVISNRTAADINPSQVEFHSVQVDTTTEPGRAILSWRTPADPDRRERWHFYGCH